MRLFYLKYPNGVTLSHQQSWSHYIEFLKIDDNLEIGFYEKGLSNKLFVSKYQTYLPEKDLQERVRKILDEEN